jgi:hypothetical protein
MQFELLPDAHLQIIVASPAARGGSWPALRDPPPVEQLALRSGRLLLKSGVFVMLLTASFAAGDYFASRPHAPELTRAAAVLPRPASTGEQQPFPDRPLPRGVAAPASGPQVPPEFQKQLQQPPTVIWPPGRAAAPPPPGPDSPTSPTEQVRGQEARGAGLPGKNPFGLEN